MDNTKKHGILWLKLNQTSKHHLHQVYPPVYDNPFYDHVTLVFDVVENEVEKYIDEQAYATVYAYAKNDKVEAVRVDTHGLPDTYGVPHITLSTKEGIEPFESVAMLKSGHDEVSTEPSFDITGTIEFIPFNDEKV